MYGRKIKNPLLNIFFYKSSKIPYAKVLDTWHFFKFPIENVYLKDFKYSNFPYYWNVISDLSEKHNFYKIVLLIIWPFDVHFAIQRLKMAKTKELSSDMRDRIIERHKEGQGYRKISKEMNLALSTIGNIIRKYKKYGDGTANLPRNGRPKKINERT